jgi:hypothetical protein
MALCSTPSGPPLQDAAADAATASLAMSDVQGIERARLRLERTRLDQQRAELETEAARISHSKDVEAVRALSGRLARHRGGLATYVAALDAFRLQYGPLGE